MIIDNLIEEILKKNNPSVVGLDPQESFIPKFLLEESFLEHGKTIKGVAESFLKFNKMIIDEIFDIVPAVKPQIAMYERYGFEGIRVYTETINYAKSKGLIVIGDIKRGDIASTAAAYADGHIGYVEIDGKKEKVFNTDFVTLSPYLGSDSISPFLDVMKETDTGAFILVKTSNKGSKDIQDLIVDDKKLFEVVGSFVENLGKDFIGKHGYSSVGAVIGATHKEECSILRDKLKSTFFLIPGYGAQGGSASDLKGCFDKNGIGGIVNSSRGIISAYKLDAYKNTFSEKEFHKAARQSAIDMKNDLNSVLN